MARNRKRQKSTVDPTATKWSPAHFQPTRCVKAPRKFAFLYIHPGTGLCICPKQQQRPHSDVDSGARPPSRPASGCPGVPIRPGRRLPANVCHGCLLAHSEPLEYSKYCADCTGRCCLCGTAADPDEMHCVVAHKFMRLREKKERRGRDDGGDGAETMTIPKDALGRSLVCRDCFAVEGVEEYELADALAASDADRTPSKDDDVSPDGKDPKKKSNDETAPFWDPPPRRPPPLHAIKDGIHLQVDECVRNMSYYFGSKMCHKGAGFEGCDVLGDEFVRANDTVSVKDETEKLLAILERSAERSVRDENAADLQKRSYELVCSWDEYTEGRADEDGDESDSEEYGNCKAGQTLDPFWSKEECAGVELVTVRNALLESWDKLFTALAREDKLTENDADWILKADEASMFVQMCSSTLGEVLPNRRGQRLLCEEGATFDNLMAYLQSLPSERRGERLRSLILNGAPRNTDPLVKMPEWTLHKRIEDYTATGIIHRQFGFDVGLAGTGKIWQIQWFDPTPKKDDPSKWRHVEAQTVDYEELMALNHNNSTKVDGVYTENKSFLLFRYSQLEKDDWEVDAREIAAATAFGSAGWGDSKIADRATTLHAANELEMWTQPCRLMRALYGGMARGPTGVREAALARARRELFSEENRCMDEFAELLMTVWDEVVLLQSRVGREKPHVERVMGKALRFARLLDDGKVPGWDDEDESYEAEAARGLMEDIWGEVADRYWDKLAHEYEDDDSWLRPKDMFFEMDRPRSASRTGTDFEARKEGHMDDHARWPHFHEPIKGWFRIAGLAMDTASGPSDSKRADVAEKRLAFVTQWRDAVLTKLRSVDIRDAEGNKLGFSGKKTSDATLALFAALDRRGIERPVEWSRLCAMMSALRKGPNELCLHLLGKNGASGGDFE